MPSESDLRDLLRDPDPEGRGAIDLDAVLTRARRRRRPRVIAAQALGSVAMIGVLGTVVFISLPPAAETTAITAQDTAAGTGEAEAAPFADQDEALKTVDECGLPFIEGGPTPWTVDIAVTNADSSAVTARVTLAIAGEGASPEAHGTLESVTVARDGVVIGTALPTDVAGPVSDSPGTISWTARFDLGTCDGAPLPPGEYEIRAVVVVSEEGTSPTSETVYGAPAPLEIG